MYIAFRTDASVLIGTGHVMRCLTLAAALRERGANCSFVYRPHQGHLQGLIVKRGFHALALPELHEGDQDNGNGTIHAHWLGTDWTEDAKDTQQVLHRHTGGDRLDWLVVDHYSLDASWEEALRPQTKHIMVIDDLADRRHACDLLLDQTFGREAADYAPFVPEGCLLVCGSQYALLRPEFAALRHDSLKRRIHPSLNEVLIAMGGVDKDNLTGAVLGTLQNCPLPLDCKLTVVMGEAAPWLKNVQHLASVMPRPTGVLVGVCNMAQLMTESDLAIGAAGTTAWERSCLGLPSIVLSIAKNQELIISNLSKAGSIIPLDASLLKIELGTIMELCARPSTLITLSSRSSAICDGQGAERIAQVIYE
jgi:UDP-2,4-diacetamido-2,4,6-trideoxy-beta-L-altropyranose hydrolase